MRWCANSGTAANPRNVLTNRYSRNISCIGAEGQKRLSASSVFIIGCGALGGQVAMLLAAAGIGRIGIADFDTIDLTNLQRQLFYTEADAGKKKVETLAARMRELNSEITVDTYDRLIRLQDAETILADYAYIIDATDNPASKYMTDELCRRLGRPGCIGGVAGWKGQIMTLTGQPASVTFADIFPPPETDMSMMPCEITGVIGAAASTIASLQAAEAIKELIRTDESPAARLLTVDLLTMQFNTFELSE